MGVALEEEKLGFIFPKVCALGLETAILTDQQIGNNSAKAGQQE
jgi:hypothetical protein